MVTRAISRFDAIPTLLRLPVDLPLVIDRVDPAGKIAANLPESDGTTASSGGGLITLERVRVMANRPEERAA